MTIKNLTENSQLSHPGGNNFIIHGDNLSVLNSMIPDYSEQIKCICIDPPYNTGVSFDHFRDDIDSSAWKSMMRPRLERLHSLLRPDGSIWIFIDDCELLNLISLCDEIFGKKNRVVNVIWNHSLAFWKDYKGQFTLEHNYILVYSKSEDFKINRLSKKPGTVWKSHSVGGALEALKESDLLFGSGSTFSTPKPERIVQKILELSTNEGDLVLDAFAGSGTTGAVAHKMKRSWILIEMGEQCVTHIQPRLRKVATGQDHGGISSAVNWQGGGGFHFLS